MALAGLSKAEKDEHCVCFAALALHDGASVIELLPPTKKGCPCDTFRILLSAPCLLYTSPSPRDRG